MKKSLLVGSRKMMFSMAVAPIVGAGMAASSDAAITTYNNFSTSSSSHAFNFATNYTPSGLPDANTLVDVTGSFADTLNYVGLFSGSPTAGGATLNMGTLVFDSVGTFTSYTIRSSSTSSTTSTATEVDSSLTLNGGDLGTTATTTTNGSATVTVPATNAGDLFVVSSSVGGKTISLTGLGALDTGITTATAGTNTSVVGINGSNLILNIPTSGNFNIATGNTLNFSNSTYTNSASASKTYTATIAGAGNINVTGGGTLRILNSNNSFTGGFTVTDGTLSISGGNGPVLGATPSAAASPQVTLNGGTFLITTTFGTTPLGVARQIGLTGGVTGNTLSQTAGYTAIAGRLSDVGTAGGFTKTGAGTTILASGVNSYTGATEVSVGTLLVDGTNITSSGVLVDSGATFGGIGTAAAITTTSGSIVSPGDPNTYTTSTGTGFTSTPAHTGAAVGTLTATGLNMVSGSVFNFDIAPGGSSDLLAISTPSAVTGDGGVFNLYVPGTTTALDTSGTYDLISEVGGYAGTTANLSVGNLPSDQTASFGIGTNGNLQVTLTTVVPEPATLGLLSGMGMLTLRRRKSK